MPDVLVGQNNYLFIKNDGNDYIGQLTGNVSGLPGLAKQILLTHLLRHEFLRSLGIRYFWVIVPGKERILGNQLPPDIAGLVRGGSSLIDRVTALAIEWNVSKSLSDFMIDLSIPLSREDPDGIFHKTDTHWTHFGANKAYSFLIDSFRDRRLGSQATDIRRAEALQQGDLGAILGVGPEKITHFSNLAFKASKIFDNKIVNGGNIQIYIHENARKPSALFLRTSSIDYMKDFILHHFNRSVLLFGADLPFHFIVNERPDYVVHMQQERYLLRPPHDTGCGSIFSAIAQKGKITEHVSSIKSYVSGGGYFFKSEAAVESANIFCGE